MVGARQGSPLVVGLCDGENFLASDALALAGSTDRFIFSEEGDVCELTLEGVRHRGPRGQRRAARSASRSLRTAARSSSARIATSCRRDFRAAARDLGHDSAVAIVRRRRCSARAPARCSHDIDHLLILACGTSYYSGLTAKYWLESIAKIPTQVEIASEYRYRESACPTRGRSSW